MNKPAKKLTLLASILAIAGMFAMPAVIHAADEKPAAASKSEKKKQRDAENLEKYDKNADGKLDPDEEAAMKADKAKGKKKKKKEEGQSQ